MVEGTNTWWRVLTHGGGCLHMVEGAYITHGGGY